MRVGAMISPSELFEQVRYLIHLLQPGPRRYRQGGRCCVLVVCKQPFPYKGKAIKRMKYPPRKQRVDHQQARRPCLDLAA